ncbi:MAG: hypothetical protein H0U75_12025 [Legionella sp.]|nr:hypothetical protein [Legionella sp.]
MLCKRITKSIIGISKIVLLVALLFLLAPQFLQYSIELNTANHFFQAHQMSFLIFHGLFYLALYWVWPKLITVLVGQNKLNESQIKMILQARVYLLAALVTFELLVWCK